MIALAAALLVQAQSGPTLVQADRSAIDRFLNLVREGKASSLTRARGYAFVKFKVWLPVPSGPELIAPEAFLRQVKGCAVKDVSYRYGQITWVCSDEIAKNPTTDPKFDRCFDVSHVATLRQGSGVIARMMDSSEWSTKRCGKSPLFAPPAPPTPPLAEVVRLQGEITNDLVKAGLAGNQLIFSQKVRPDAEIFFGQNPVQKRRLSAGLLKKLVENCSRDGKMEGDGESVTVPMICNGAEKRTLKFFFLKYAVTSVASSNAVIPTEFGGPNG